MHGPVRGKNFSASERCIAIACRAASGCAMYCTCHDLSDRGKPTTSSVVCGGRAHRPSSGAAARKMPCMQQACHIVHHSLHECGKVSVTQPLTRDHYVAISPERLSLLCGEHCWWAQRPHLVWIRWHGERMQEWRRSTWDVLSLHSIIRLHNHS